MYKKLFYSLFVMLFLVSCAHLFLERHNMESAFDLNEISWFNKKGNNTIKGSGFLRQTGGGIVSCAGIEVLLIPISKYANKRALVYYNSHTKGFRAISDSSLSFRDAAVDTEVDRQFLQASKSSVCNIQGFFSVTELPNGTYYIITTVTWEAPDPIWGGIKKMAVA